MQSRGATAGLSRSCEGSSQLHSAHRCGGCLCSGATAGRAWEAVGCIPTAAAAAIPRGGGRRRGCAGKNTCDLALFKLAPRLQIALREGL